MEFVNRDEVMRALPPVLRSMNEGVLPISLTDELRKRILALPTYTPAPTEAEDATVSLGAPTGSAVEQAEVLKEALQVYIERSAERKDAWREAGVRGHTVFLLEKAQRAFIQAMAGEVPNRDHFRDMINFAAFAIRMIDEGEQVLSGSWPWPKVDNYTLEEISNAICWFEQASSLPGSMMTPHAIITRLEELS